MLYLCPRMTLGGHELVRAGGGREALQIMERGGIDLVLLDLMMPDLDGIDVLLHLRAHEGGVRVLHGKVAVIRYGRDLNGLLVIEKAAKQCVQVYEQAVGAMNGR